MNRTLRHPSVAAQPAPPVMSSLTPKSLNFDTLIASQMTSREMRARVASAFGRAFRELRDHGKLDRSVWASRMGITKNQVRDIEEGNIYPEKALRDRILGYAKRLEHWRPALLVVDQACAFRDANPVPIAERGRMDVTRTDPASTVRPVFETDTFTAAEAERMAAAGRLVTPTPTTTETPEEPVMTQAATTTETTLLQAACGPRTLPTKDMPFHVALWTLRTEAGYSRGDVAAVLDVTDGAVEQWESNANNPIRAHYEQLCNLLPSLDKAKAPPVRDIPKPMSGPRSVRPVVLLSAVSEAAPETGDLRSALQLLRRLEDVRATLRTEAGAGVESVLWLLRSAAASSMSAAEVLALLEGS